MRATAAAKRRSSSVLLALASAACILALATPQAHAQRVVTSYVINAAIDGRYAYYTKPGSERISNEQVSTQVMRFDLASHLTQAVFTAPQGWAVTDFGARNGRLAALVDPDPSDDVGTAKLVVMNADGSAQLEVGSITDEGNDHPCFGYLGLVAVTDSGKAVMNRTSSQPFPGSDCAARRLSVSATAVGADGANATLFDVTSPWIGNASDEGGWDGFVFVSVFITSHLLLDATDDWLLQNGLDGRSLAITDRHTGKVYSKRFDVPPSAIHAWADGNMFVAYDSDPNRAYVATIASAEKPKELTRRNAQSSFRPCGAMIVELYQRYKRRRNESFLRLALRDDRGAVVRDIAQRIPEGSSIEDCDGKTALLSYNAGNEDVLASAARSKRKPTYLFTVPL